jgi:hypothetical protein
MFILSIVSIFCSLSVFAQPVPLLQIDLPGWYHTQTQHKVDERFGITRLELYKDELLIGMATQQQGAVDRDGALVASLDLSTNKLTKVAYLFEQGLLDMEIINDVLHVPGTDPRFRPFTDPKDEVGYPAFYWNLGNWYRIDLRQQPRKRELIRNLPFVVHGWGQWYNAKNKVIYHATSRVVCDHPKSTGDCYQVPDATQEGAIFVSKDFGSNWELFSNSKAIGRFRTYDVHGTEQALFVVWSDERDKCGIARKQWHETTWTRIEPLRVPCYLRLQSYQNQLLAVDEIQQLVVLISSTQSIDPAWWLQTWIPPYKVLSKPAIWGWDQSQIFKVSPDEKTIYFLGLDGLYVSEDLVSWNRLDGSQNLGKITDFSFDKKGEWIYISTRTQVYKVHKGG